MRAGLPAAADAVFARALARSPQDRYRTCGEFSDALCRALGLAYQPAPYQQGKYQQGPYQQFTNVHGGVLTHVIDLGFIVRPHVQAYAIELYGPQADWSSVHGSMWSKVLATFEPAA